MAIVNGQVPSGQVAPDPAHGGPVNNATLLELIGRFINDLSDLADRQVELAKQEINDTKDQAIGAVLKISIGAGIAFAAAVLLVIWAWTAFIWFFNWLGSFVVIGPVTLAWMGWVLGVMVPAVAAFIGYQRFIKGGIAGLREMWPPMARTRATLKEDLEWVRQLRTPNAR